jgi:hypothetical protein
LYTHTCTPDHIATPSPHTTYTPIVASVHRLLRARGPVGRVTCDRVVVSGWAVSRVSWMDVVRAPHTIQKRFFGRYAAVKVRLDSSLKPLWQAARPYKCDLDLSFRPLYKFKCVLVSHQRSERLAPCFLALARRSLVGTRLVLGRIRLLRLRGRLSARSNCHVFGSLGGRNVQRSPSGGSCDQLVTRR